MVGPALASSFRQQASENTANNNKAGPGGNAGYGGYGSYSNNDEYRGAYGGGGQGGRRPSEDGQRYNNNYNSNMDGMSNGMQPSSTSHGLSGGPPLPSSSSSYSTRPQQQQQQSYQNYRQQLQQDDSHNMGSSSNSYSNSIPSPTSMNGNGGQGAGGSSVPSSSSVLSSKQQQQQQQPPPTTGSPEEIENSRRIARVHFEEFKAYLDAEGQRDPNARANAREKLTRLTRPQFQELSTDVYDELMRRQRAEGSALSGSAPEFLPQKSDFHPKRNQARQKLSTLPKTRFRDLASDVYFELERRYPEFKEDELPPSSLHSTRSSEDTMNNGNGGLGAGRLGNGYPGNNSNQVQLPSRSASRDDGQGAGGPRLQSSTSHKRPQFPQGKPSMDYQSNSSSSVPTLANGAVAAPSTAANEVIIPNKSKVIEEDISLPASTAPQSSSQQGPSGIAQQQQQQRGYGSYANQNGYMGRKSSERERPNMNGGNNSQDSIERDNSVSPNLNHTGNSANDGPIPRKSNDTPRLGGAPGNSGPLLPTSPDWSNSLARASEASSLGTRLIGGYGSTPSESGGQGGGMRDWESDELEKVKSDYEYKIATMQNRMAGLEKDLRDTQESKDKIEKESDERLNELENELEKMKMRNEDAQNNIEHLERELSDAKEQIRSLPSSYESSAVAASASKDAEHKEEISRLEREVDSFRNKYNNEKDATENLKHEIEGLVDTLKEMNMRQDDLANEREADLEKIRSLEEEVKEWKARYEHAKTELRELKATSQLFVKPTKADDDYMPTSPGGAIMDSHVTRFQSSIDDLLISGRSDAPSSVIIATKQVINAVARIDEDVQEYESAGMAEHLSPDDRERLYALKSKCNATLSNLTTAARNHATGHGLSPVSLLDAAASHLSNTIIELVRLLLMRKAGTPLLSSATQSPSMKPSVSSTSISSRLEHASQSSSSNTAQQQSRNFPTRLASLKREEEAPSFGGGSQNAPGSSGRTSPASFRSKTVTASDRTHATSPEPQIRGGDTSNSNSSFGDRNNKMNASTSETSLASNFNPDPRRNAYQQQQQQQQPYQQQQQYHQERDDRSSSRQDQHHQYHQANESQGSMRSHASNQSYQHERDESRESGSDRQQQEDYRDEDVTEKQEVNGDAEDWADLKNYLESQTEAIVHSITALLAAIRGGAQPIKLQENLSQIITIVSSIVQILQDNLPSNLYEESKPTIQELSSNCDKLIELQNSADASGPGGTQTFSKQTKQAMATASFGVAKSLKSINSLLASA